MAKIKAAWYSPGIASSRRFSAEPQRAGDAADPPPGIRLFLLLLYPFLLALLAKPRFTKEGAFAPRRVSPHFAATAGSLPKFRTPWGHEPLGEGPSSPRDVPSAAAPPSWALAPASLLILIPHPREPGLPSPSWLSSHLATCKSKIDSSPFRT